MNRTLKALALFALPAALAVPAFAGPSPQTDDFDVTATVNGSCNIISTADIAFGVYDPADVNFTTPLDGTGSVTIRCVRGTVVDVALGQGLFAGAGSTCAAPLRRMSDGGTERLGYDIYQDAARTTVWGCAATNDQTYTSGSPSTPTTLTTYGRVPAGQDVAAGSYDDTVVVTATF
jgi:spore coat protein U-like protein